AVTTPSATSISDAAPWIERLIHAFGTPNNCYGTEICNWHKDHAHRFTTGAPIGIPDWENAGCLVFWGHNPSTAWLAQAVAAADVVETARLLWTHRPVSYHAWSGVGQHTNASQTDRAIALCLALTGSLDAPGGNRQPATVPVNDVGAADLMAPAQYAKALG